MTDRRDEPPIVIQQSSGDGGSGIGVGILIGLAIIALLIAIVWWTGMGSGAPGTDAGSTNPLPSVVQSLLPSITY